MDDAIADHLIGLMTLTGDEDDVAGRRVGHGPGNGFAPVQNALELSRTAPGKPFLDLLDDRFGPLAPRVVAGDDGVVGQLAGNPAHERTLPLVTVAATAEDEDDAPSGGQSAHGV